VVTAVQQYPGLADSPPATATFALTPPAPAISSITEGQHLLQDALPAIISVTGLNGADMAVFLDGASVSPTPAGDEWSVPFPAGLAAGTHTVSATQTVDGVASAPASVTFSIDAPAPVLTAGNIQEGGPAAPGAGGLPRTGSSALVPAAAGAAGASIVVGAVLLALARRRRQHHPG
jgi:LPXTG-motif cell wall-anchored protein